MNQFEELCKLASYENWCWNLFCTTCGHMHFRYAFKELADGKSPADPTWLIHGHNTRYSKLLGPIPRNYTKDQKEKVINICCNSDISSIAKTCKFPDWLGYLGLILEHMRTESESYKKLSRNWASQLSRLVPNDSTVRVRLIEMAEGNGVLNIRDLELCEISIKHNNAQEGI